MRGAMEEGRMDVAQPLHIPQRQAFLHQFLLGLHDLRRLHVVEVGCEVGPYGLQFLSLRQPLEIGLQQSDSFLGVYLGVVVARVPHRGSRFHLIIYRGLGGGGGSRNFETMLLQAADDVGHADTFHLRALWNGHNLADRAQHHFLLDFREAQRRHDIHQLRVFLCQFENRLA